MAAQPNSVTARSRPARPSAAARAGSRQIALTASARPASNSSGGTGRYGTSVPVSPSATTSGMPPIADATTAVSHAIASRLTMPSGSYTDGHTNTVACDSSGTTSRRASISWIQTTPVRVRLRSSTVAAVSAAISLVSGAPAQSTSWIVRVERRAPPRAGAPAPSAG